MLKNVGTIDRIIRILIAVALVVTGIVLSGQGLWWIALIAILPLATAGLAYCPLYHVVGIKTISVKKL